ncbi:hypothetical protein TWF481_012141 [Arthrobotrys musiformis]|uniref:F-box domain-containing protein n=1 Tax=Arthrobotrys musiformis TaxID=47236 RepID=A0AAV9VY99_9PEZI
MDEFFKSMGIMQHTYESTDTDPANARFYFRILEVPREIQLSIFQELPYTTLKAVRLAHSSFRHVAASILFRRWTLDISLYVPKKMSQFDWPGAGSANHRWLDERDQTKMTVQLPISAGAQLQALWDSYENRSDELQVLFDNVQELFIREYELDEGFMDKNLKGKTWPREPEWGVEVLKSFLGRMRKLRSIDWDIAPYDLDGAMTSPSLAANLTHLSVTRTKAPVFLAKKMVKSLSGFLHLTNITNLDIKLLNQADIASFNHLPNLKNLTFEAIPGAGNIATFLTAQTVPFKLRSLTLKNDISGIIFPDEVFTKYLSTLQSLHLPTPEAEIEKIKDTRPRPIDQDIKSIWTHLAEHGIYLCTISTFGQSASLLTYLLSYPQNPATHPLESLEVRVWPHRTTYSADAHFFVNTLWNQIIPLHKRTLRRIAIYPEARSVTYGGTHLQRIKWDTVTSLRESSRSPKPIPDAELCTLNPRIEKLLKTCPKLESLEMGSMDWNGASEFLKFVLFEMPRGVRDVGFHLDGWARRLKGWDHIGSSGAYYAREFAAARKPLISAVWDHEGEPDSKEVLDDMTWRRLKINIKPLDEMWFVGGGTGQKWKWKLMDKDLEKQICSRGNQTERLWTSVMDVGRGELDSEYNSAEVNRMAVQAGRYDPVAEEERHAEFMRKIKAVSRAARSD